MSDHYVGFFVVPASSLDLLHRVEEEALQAIDAWRSDQSWRLGLVFQRAAEAAVVSEIVDGPCEPLTNSERNDAYFRTRLWLMTRFLDGDPHAVLDPEQFDALVMGFNRTTEEEFLAWNADHGSGQYPEVASERLSELYEALGRALHARLPARHGFVYAHLWEEDRHPPGPEPVPKEETISRADAVRRSEWIMARFKAQISRQRRPWWPEEPHRSSRVLVGLLAPGRAAELGEAYHRALAMFHGDEVRAGLAALNDEVLPAVEQALREPMIETVGGAVEALLCLQAVIRQETGEDAPVVCSLAQAVELDAMLEGFLSDEMIELVWKQEKHWTRDQLRETYDRLRGVLRRAIEREQGFAWAPDDFRH